MNTNAFDALLQGWAGSKQAFVPAPAQQQPGAPPQGDPNAQPPQGGPPPQGDPNAQPPQGGPPPPQGDPNAQPPPGGQAEQMMGEIMSAVEQIVQQMQMLQQQSDAFAKELGGLKQTLMQYEHQIKMLEKAIDDSAKAMPEMMEQMPMQPSVRGGMPPNIPPEMLQQLMMQMAAQGGGGMPPDAGMMQPQVLPQV